MADNGLFQVKIISPDRIFFEGEADLLEMTTSEGEIGILKGHIPLTAIVAPGALKIHNGQQMSEAALLSGFVEILPDQVTILAEAVEWPEEIDVNRAEESRIRAERRLKSAKYDSVRANASLMRSLVRIEVAKHGHH